MRGALSARLLQGVATIASCALAAPEAAAYCRTTTCDPLVQACARNADGCVRDGAPASWASSALPYRFAEATPDALRNAFSRAASRWTSVECDGRRTSLRLRELEPSAGAAFEVAFTRDIEDRPPDELGVTRLSFGDRSGTVRHARMEIDLSALAGDRSFDLEVVLVHEIGHYIGLAHNSDVGSAMQAQYPAIVSRASAGRDGGVLTRADLEAARALGDEDIRAVCALYPPQPLRPLPQSCAATADSPRVDGGAIGSALVAIAFVTTRRRVGSSRFRNERP